MHPDESDNPFRFLRGSRIRNFQRTHPMPRAFALSRSCLSQLSTTCSCASCRPPSAKGWLTRYEKLSTIVTSNRPFDDWPKLIGDVIIVTPLLDLLKHHSHLLKFDGESWRPPVGEFKVAAGDQEQDCLGRRPMAGARSRVA